MATLNPSSQVTRTHFMWIPTYITVVSSLLVVSKGLRRGSPPHIPPTPCIIDDGPRGQGACQYEGCTADSTTILHLLTPSPPHLHLHHHHTITSHHHHTITSSHHHLLTDELPDLNDTCYDKVALLIGNKKYHQGQLMLNTPENDTQDLAGVLRSAGFKVVSLVNLTKIEMDQVLE